MVVLPNRDRRAERREATRTEILDAAWAVAHESGLPGLTLREVAVRVGMQPPSLYSHFASKNAIYDAMFRQAWEQWLEHVEEHRAGMPAEPRSRLAAIGLLFFDFSVSDVARYQLMNVRSIHDFTPSAEAYAPSLQAMDMARTELRLLGLSTTADVDLYTALIAGLVSQQLANEPGGTRWRRLLPRAMEMLADDVGLPRVRRGTKR
jgi:AcrR family transcriptional regulator